MKVKSLSLVRVVATPGVASHQAPPSMGFSRQEYWCGLPFPSPGDLPDPEIEPRSSASQANSLPSKPQGKPLSKMGSLSWRHKDPLWTQSLEGTEFQGGTEPSPRTRSDPQGDHSQGPWFICPLVSLSVFPPRRRVISASYLTQDLFPCHSDLGSHRRKWSDQPALWEISLDWGFLCSCSLLEDYPDTFRHCEVSQVLSTLVTQW